MKKFRIESLRNGKPVPVFGSLDKLEIVAGFLEKLMIQSPMIPYRIVTVTEEYCEWQNLHRQSEEKMLNCQHQLQVAVGWAICQICKWSELTATAGMYKIEELNR